MVDYYCGVRLLKDTNTKQVIGIEWQFDNRKNIRYYPEDINSPWFIEFCDSVRKEKNLRDRLWRHEISMAADEMYLIFRDSRKITLKIDNEDEELFCQKYISLLTEREKKILAIRMENQDISIRDISNITNISKSSVGRALSSMKEKYMELKKEKY